MPRAPFDGTRWVVEAASLCDIGVRRDLNEDQCFVSTQPTGLPGLRAVAVVSDGMGGHDAGDVASKMVCERMDHLFNRQGAISFAAQTGVPLQDYPSILHRVFTQLHERILDRARSFNLQKSMGCTCVAAIVREEEGAPRLHLGWVGDSRCYILRGKNLILATEDDSFVWKLFSNGSIRYEDMRIHPQRNILTQALGTGEGLKPHVRSLLLARGDRLLLCSDGIHGALPDAEIRSILLKNEELSKACEALVEAANGSGGKDNATAVILRVGSSRSRISGMGGPPRLRSSIVRGVAGIVGTLSIVGAAVYFSAGGPAHAVPTATLPPPLLTILPPANPVYAGTKTTVRFTVDPRDNPWTSGDRFKVVCWANGRPLDSTVVQGFGGGGKHERSITLSMPGPGSHSLRLVLFDGDGELAASEAIVRVSDVRTETRTRPSPKVAERPPELPYRFSRGLDGNIQVWLSGASTADHQLDVEISIDGSRNVVSLNRRHRTIPKATLLPYRPGASVRVRTIGDERSHTLVLR